MMASTGRMTRRVWLEHLVVRAAHNCSFLPRPSLPCLPSLLLRAGQYLNFLLHENSFGVTTVKSSQVAIAVATGSNSHTIPSQIEVALQRTRTL